jgi:hypothetical protein
MYTGDTATKPGEPEDGEEQLPEWLPVVSHQFHARVRAASGPSPYAAIVEYIHELITQVHAAADTIVAALGFPR